MNFTTSVFTFYFVPGGSKAMTGMCFAAFLAMLTFLGYDTSHGPNQLTNTLFLGLGRVER